MISRKFLLCVCMLWTLGAALTLPPDGEFAGERIMWAKQDIPGGQDAFVEVTLHQFNSTGATGNLALIFYNALDESILKAKRDDVPFGFIICLQSQVDAGLCSQNYANKFRFNRNFTGNALVSEVKEVYLDVASISFPHSVKYQVQKTGLYYYGITWLPSNNTIQELDFAMRFQQPYGFLDPSYYPLLPFHGFLALNYCLLCLFWIAVSVRYWQKILPVQHYIGFVILAAMVDNAFSYGFYDNWNATGTPSTSFLVFVSFVSALRISASLFVLLIVSLGYGVIKPTLGDDMRKCVFILVCLVVTFFLFNIALLIDNLSMFGALFFIMPLAVCFSLYVLTLFQGLNQNIEHLEIRRQTHKLQMYRWVKRSIVGIFLVMVIFMLFGSIFLARSRNSLFLAQNIKVFWLIKWGWMNFLYLVSLAIIAFFWRPTENNDRYGLEELPDIEGHALDDLPTFDYYFSENVKNRQPDDSRRASPSNADGQVLYSGGETESVPDTVSDYLSDSRKEEMVSKLQ